MVQELPDSDAALSRLHVFSTADETMSLNMFVYGTQPGTERLSARAIRQIAASILDYAATVQAGNSDLLQPSPLFKPDTLVQYMTKCTETYLRIGCDEPARFLRQVLLVDKVEGSEGTAVHISESEHEPDHYWVDLDTANSLPQATLENMCRLLYVHCFDVARARLDIIPVENGTVTMLRTLVSPVDNKGISKRTFNLLAHELKRAKWLDPQTHELVFEPFPGLGVTRGEIITGLCAAVHPVLAKENAIAYSNTNIYNTVSNKRFIKHATAIADLFLERFNPESPLSEDEFASRCDEIGKAIDTDVEDSVAIGVLMKMVDVVKHTLKRTCKCRIATLCLYDWILFAWRRMTENYRTVSFLCMDVASMAFKSQLQVLWNSWGDEIQTSYL